MKDVAIKVSNLSKKYTIGANRVDTLTGTLSSFFKRKKTTDFWALDNISFEVEKGDVVGIIGRNGAGKSTLLKILSKITKCSKGQVELFGRIASLLEVGTGFHPELTGRENIFLNGSLLGLTRKEIKERLDDIIAFSGIEKFINTPVKKYSSGMYVRLAFSVAAHLEPEILVIDEVLAVGDYEFQQKCLGKMNEVAKSGRTVLIVSHNLSHISQICNKGILLNEGKIEALGNIEQIIQSYETIIKNKSYITKKQEYVSLDEEISTSWSFHQHETIKLEIGLKTSKQLSNLKIDFFICNSKNEQMYHLRSDYVSFDFHFDKYQKIALQILKPNLIPDDYNLTIYVYDEMNNVYLWLENYGQITIVKDHAIWPTSLHKNFANHLPKFSLKCQ